VNIKKKFIKKIFIIINFTFIFPFIFNNISFAQNIQNSNQLPNWLFYDADEIKINKNSETFSFDGNAIILIGNVYISANKIISQKKIGLITAEGNVNLINNKQKAVASRIVFDINTKQFRMDDAQIFSDPKVTEEKVSEITLGLTKAEIAFEKAKEKRTKEIENDLKSIREEYAKLLNLKNIKKKNDTVYSSQLSELRSKYSRLLARLTRTQFQPNAILAALPEKDREKLIERRQAVEKFNKDNPEMVDQVVNFSAIKGYVKVAASQIVQKDNKTLILNNAIITPCNCSPYNEPPIYGFSTQDANIELDNYITMKDVTFDLFSIPVFYSPWLKFPIKNKRETGLLPPNSYTSTNAGTATTVPLFIVMGPYADSTISYEYFSSSGSQITGEFRFQIEEDSQLRTEAKFIKDKNYQNKWDTNNSNVNNAIAQSSDPATQSMYDSFRGSRLQDRWYSGSSINIPILEKAAVKTNAEFVSDNTYLSDYSSNNPNVNPTAAVYGDTSSASRRFLNQELSTEYYGDNITISAQGQTTKDLFAPDASTTPNKTPKIEIDILPDRYFNLPLIFSSNSTFENITRKNQQNFIPIAQNVFSPLGSNQTSSYIPGGQKNPNDPYAQGNRVFTSSTVSLPIPANDYVNANISTTAVGTQYYFPDSYPYQDVQPYLGYLIYKAHLDVPLYSSLNLVNEDNSTKGKITQNLVPFVDINHIPSVTRSSNYPNTYQLWYDQDKTVSSSIINFGAMLSWTIEKEEFIESKDPISRLPINEEPGVANLSFFNEIINDNNLNISSNSNEIYQFSSDSNASKIFDLWAKKELDNYYEKISSNEFKQNYVWPSGSYYSKNIIWKMTPLSLSVSAGYNLVADKTANETNSLAGPTVSPVPAQKYTDIVASATVDLNPLIPVRGVFSTNYNQYYHRINTTSLSVNAELPYGLNISYTNNQQFVIDPTNQNQNSFIKKTQQTAGVTYTPVAWMQFGYQWSENTDPTATNTDLSNGKAYGSSQNITFLNLQNCLDLTIARNKPAGVPENLATYALTLTFRFFGYTQTTPQLGDYINRNLTN